MKNIFAVVVTYNRKALLLECLKALLDQTIPLARIIIVDNASTDGTQDALADCGLLDNALVAYIRADRNEGGAGGFYRGMKIALSNFSCEGVWIMDDDTIPDKDCLKKLCEGYEEVVGTGVTPSFLASAIYGANNESMNVPDIDDGGSVDGGYPDWYRLLSKGIVKIKRATFVSLLFPRKSLLRCGLPCKYFFIWGDDTEFTSRLVRFSGPAYFVGSSIAIHKRAIARRISIINETDPARVKMFSYMYRNHGIISRYYLGMRAYIAYLRMELRGVVPLIFKGRMCAVKAVLKGILLSFLQYKKFKNFIDGELGKR